MKTPVTRFDDFGSWQKVHQFLRNFLEAYSQAILDAAY
jgi:hypothetical protein